jgi:hypothetical protein
LDLATAATTGDEETVDGSDGFDCFATEDPQFTDPLSYLLDVNWTTLMPRKFVVISAPMDVGRR